MQQAGLKKECAYRAVYKATSDCAPEYKKRWGLNIIQPPFLFYYTIIYLDASIGT